MEFSVVGFSSSSRISGDFSCIQFEFERWVSCSSEIPSDDLVNKQKKRWKKSLFANCKLKNIQTLMVCVFPVGKRGVLILRIISFRHFKLFSFFLSPVSRLTTCVCVWEQRGCYFFYRMFFLCSAMYARYSSCWIPHTHIYNSRILCFLHFQLLRRWGTLL